MFGGTGGPAYHILQSTDQGLLQKKGKHLRKEKSIKRHFNFDKTETTTIDRNEDNHNDKNKYKLVSSKLNHFR